MIGKPILRVAKIKKVGASTLQSVDGHLSRTRPTPNADPSKTPANVWLVGGPSTLTNSVDRIMAKAGLADLNTRKDAVVANDILLSVSPEWFRDNPDDAGRWKADRLETFRREAQAFLREQFGPRVACAVMHLDESTPHIQAVVVPILKTDTGHRLSGRDYFNPPKLEALQEAWETRLKAHGVGLREKGSTARHTTVKSYYSALDRAPDVPKPLPPSPPPLKALLPGGGSALADWQKTEATKVAKRQKPLAAAAAKGMLFEAERQAGNAMRAELDDQGQRLAKLRDQLTDVRHQLELSKEQIAKLRGVSVNEVAKVLDYAGDIGKKENAIDLVKRVGGLSFEDATRWLAIAFSPAVAGDAVRRNTANVPIAEPILTTADKVKATAIIQQLDALGAESYRITAMHIREDGTKYATNFGKSKEGDAERLWNSSEVLKQIPKMTSENARGGNIYITPIDPSAHFALIDDLKPEKLDELKGKGYTFSTITETSPNNFQAVVKVSKKLDSSPVNEWFKSMNREHGDPKITGLEHPMRLAGFQNRKSKYEKDGFYPFVRLVECARTFCTHARAVIASMADQMAKERSDTLPASGARRRA
jgi:hypothetical protein